MPVRITGRHLEVTPDIREYIEKKLPKLEKYTDRAHSVEMVLEKSKYQHKVELRLKAGPIAVDASMQDADLSRAIDLLLDKVERQLQKKMERLRGNKKHRADSVRKGTLPVAGAAREELAPSPRGGTATLAPRRVKRAKKAEAAANRHDLPIVAENVGVRIFPAQQVLMHNMSVEEAAEELYFTDEHFFLFINEESHHPNVIFRRRDGNFGLVEPIGEDE